LLNPKKILSFALNKRLKQVIKEENPIEVKDKIIEASRNLFIQKGFKGTSIRDIAAASGTNVAMVNYYFRSKHNLFEEIFEEAFNILTGKVFAVFDSELPFFETIRNWVSSYYDTLSEYPQLPLFLMYEISQHPDSLTKRISRKRPSLFFNKLAERLRREEEKGTIRKTPPTDLILNVVALCMHPFIFKPIAGVFLNLSKEEYCKLIKTHKAYAIEFVINAIKI
jgi:AcrR family transcriptional regulator